mmetsp:Transcript_56832/g.179751  ORF Transcript_56832/g.179751 Transcript_56832/m.179751 type:complete len:212 (-) Transcript_56832:478-1113(-)
MGSPWPSSGRTLRASTTAASPYASASSSQAGRRRAGTTWSRASLTSSTISTRAPRSSASRTAPAGCSRRAARSSWRGPSSTSTGTRAASTCSARAATRWRPPNSSRAACVTPRSWASTGWSSSAVMTPTPTPPPSQSSSRASALVRSWWGAQRQSTATSRVGRPGSKSLLGSIRRARSTLSSSEICTWTTSQARSTGPSCASWGERPATSP